MNRLGEIINEEISAIKKDKKVEIFDYHSIINNAWTDKVNEAKKFQRILFDLENDDTTGEKKTFYVKKNLRKDQPVKYEFNAELMEAGGDWEYPVMYFRLEFTHDYFNKYEGKPEFIWDLERNYKGLYDCYVIIPPADAGNKLLPKNDDYTGHDYDWFAYQESEMTKEDKKLAEITDADKKNCWMWLQILLENLVNDRHKMLDEPADEPKDSED
jgi:hypothetical protein